MAYTRNYRTIVPLLPGDDVEVVRWLARESFDRKAADEFMTITDYSESMIGADEVPPKLAERLGRPVTDFQWWLFTGTASA